MVITFHFPLSLTYSYVHSSTCLAVGHWSSHSKREMIYSVHVRRHYHHHLSSNHCFFITPRNHHHCHLKHISSYTLILTIRNHTWYLSHREVTQTIVKTAKTIFDTSSSCFLFTAYEVKSSRTKNEQFRTTLSLFIIFELWSLKSFILRRERTFVSKEYLLCWLWQHETLSWHLKKFLLFHSHTGLYVSFTSGRSLWYWDYWLSPLSLFFLCQLVAIMGYASFSCLHPGAVLSLFIRSSHSHPLTIPVSCCV